MDKPTLNILLALHKMGAMMPSQLSRFLFDTRLAEAFDIVPMLSRLREEGLLKQGLSVTGITYTLTQAGEAVLESQAAEISDDSLCQFEAVSREYNEIFKNEKDYIAQYTEQANGIFPLFLSIRKKEKILMQVNILVNDEATAKAITKSWMEHAAQTYDAVWTNISEGLDLPRPQL